MRTRSSRHAAAAAAVFVVVVAQLVALAHQANVRHVRCAEHGELVEGATLDAHPLNDVCLVGVDAGGATDDHCTISSGLRAARTPSGSPVLVATQTELCTEIPPVAGRPLPHATLYLIAPKTSPPGCWTFAT